MPEAVIVSTARSPIGRAFKGSLKELRPDDLTATDHPGRAGQGPRAGPARHRRPDARLRPARRRAGAQPRPHRRRADGHGPPARLHHHPLLLLLAADHPDGAARHQGRRGRRLHLGRRRDGLALHQGQLGRPAGHPRTRSSPTPRPAPRGRAESGGVELARPARGRPGAGRRTSRWARPRRTWRALKGITRQDRTSSASARRTSPRRRIADGFWAARDHPGHPAGRHRRRARTTARAPASPWRASRACKPVFRPDGTVTAGNCCPLNDGAAALVVMSDTKARELGLTPLARVVSTGVTGAVAGDHGPRPGRGEQAGARSAPA